MTRTIRIVSDLHVGHGASLLESVEALRPLAEGVDRLILNGDTLELKYGEADSASYSAARQFEQFKKEIAIWSIQVDAITGNHDPTISDLHSLTLFEGQIFITHGDGLFPDIAPWSSHAPTLRKCGNIDENETGNTPEALHEYLAKHKQASIDAHKLDSRYNPTRWSKLKIFLHQSWPPITPFRILKSWREIPDRAVSLATRFNLSPAFIILGHSHNPGIWRRGKSTVINLGAYFQWPGARCVDIEDGILSVRKVAKGRNHIELGRPVAQFELKQTAVQSPQPGVC